MSMVTCKYVHNVHNVHITKSTMHITGSVCSLQNRHMHITRSTMHITGSHAHNAFWLCTWGSRDRSWSNCYSVWGCIPKLGRGAHDDGFNQVTRNRVHTETWIRNCRWLKDMQLTEFDINDIVGQSYQKKLAHKYLRTMTDALKFGGTQRCCT